MVSLSPVTAKLCTRASLAAGLEYAEENDEAVQVISLVVECCGGKPAIMGGAELARLTATCRELRNLFDRSDVWTLRFGLRVANLHGLSEHFSTFLLARHIHSQRAHAHLTRNILLGLAPSHQESFSEKQLLSSTAVTEVFVCETPQDEQAFWTGRFASALRTSAVPTVTQVDNLRSSLAVVLAIGADDADPMATVEEIVAMASTEGTNGVLRAVVFAMLCDPEQMLTNQAQAQAEPQSDTSPAADDMVIDAGDAAPPATDAQSARSAKKPKAAGNAPPTRLRPLIGDSGYSILADVGCAFQAVGFLHGLNVDEVMEEKWKLTKKALPAAIHRAFLDALAGFSCMQLYDLWRTRGFWKAFFRTTHMNALILKKATAAERAPMTPSETKPNRSAAQYRKVGFFLSALHAERYPDSAAMFAESKWACRIVEPMRAMCDHPLFSARDAAWLQLEFQQQLAGKKVQLPLRDSVSAVLSREGNTEETWLKLFEADAVSLPQIFANLRSLALVVPVTKVEQLIQRKIDTGTASVGLAELMTIRTVLSTGILADSQVETLRGRVAAYQAGIVSAAGEIGGSYRIEGISMSFRDKRGQMSTQQKTKNISSSFGMDTIQGYREMTQRMLRARLNAQPAADPGTVAAVVLTHEVVDNLVRTGIPPRTPEYAPASLWRGEALTLQRLHALSNDLKAASAPDSIPQLMSEAGMSSDTQKFDTLIVGITWCEHPSGSAEYKQVDLDLSVVAFDPSWSRLTHCSYTILTTDGMKHSGDITTAPHPVGAREDVRVTLSELPAGTRYLALTVHNFTKQPMNECCADASVFVASTRPGLGPGGLDIISSAALKGKGTNVLAGVLQLPGGESDVHTFLCCDQEMLKGTAAEVSGNNVETTTDLVGRTALAVLDGSGLSNAPTKPRLTEIAALASASVADAILIEHAGADNLTVLQRDEVETRFDFASRVLETLLELKPTTAPCYPFRATLCDAIVPPERLIVFGGELEQKDATRLLAKTALPQHKTRPQPTVVLVNLRSNQEQVEHHTCGPSSTGRTYWAVTAGGADVAPAIGRALEKIREEAGSGHA